ncbi:MAG TPA: GAF domain-containing sensor histidine kinase [Armatimonadota bacterium]
MGVVVASAAALSSALYILHPPGIFTPTRWLALLVAGVVLHILNQLNFTIRFSGQPDNVEITFTEAALVALFFEFSPTPIVLLSGLVHLIREVQAHRRRKVQVVFNTSEIMFSVALAGFVYAFVRERFGLDATVMASVAAMFTHAVSNRLLVGTVISLNAGHFHSRYYKSLFVENVVMLFMNVAVGMTAVMAFALQNNLLLWVPFTILLVVYLGYQAYVGQLRDSNTLTRLYENALLTNTESEAALIPNALAKALDNFSSRRVSLTMASGPDALGEWTLERDHRVPVVTRATGSLRDRDGASAPMRVATDEPEHARAWRPGAKYNAMAAPVQYEGQLLGVLRAEKPRAWDAFTSGDLRAFGLFARQMGVALENARLMELDREQQHLRQKALDAERNRISRDLHDSFVQTLVQIDLHLAYLERLLEKRPSDAPAEIAELQANVRDGLAEARSYMAELKPLRIEPGEFFAVAQRYLDDFARQYGVAAELETDEQELALSGDDLTELFQIVREALNNVAKHAKANHVCMRVASGDTHVTVAVADDGVGFDVAATGDLRQQGHYGLSNICERAGGMGGAVYWDSSGKGTTLTVTLPRRAPSDVLKGVPV